MCLFTCSLVLPLRTPEYAARMVFMVAGFQRYAKEGREMLTGCQDDRNLAPLSAPASVVAQRSAVRTFNECREEPGARKGERTRVWRMYPWAAARAVRDVNVAAEPPPILSATSRGSVGEKHAPKRPSVFLPQLCTRCLSTCWGEKRKIANPPNTKYYQISVFKHKSVFKPDFFHLTRGKKSAFPHFMVGLNDIKVALRCLFLLAPPELRCFRMTSLISRCKFLIPDFMNIVCDTKTVCKSILIRYSSFAFFVHIRWESNFRVLVSQKSSLQIYHTWDVFSAFTSRPFRLVNSTYLDISVIFLKFNLELPWIKYLSMMVLIVTPWHVSFFGIEGCTCISCI